MEIKKLGPSETSDFRSLVAIFNEVFAHEGEIPAPEYLAKLLANPDFLVFVAQADGQVVGGLTIYVLHSYRQPKPIAYIYDVGVAPSFQGQGVGKALILEVCRYCQAHGFEDAYVEAESDDLDAVAFYRRTPYSSELQAVHFTYSFGDDR